MQQSFSSDSQPSPQSALQASGSSEVFAAIDLADLDLGYEGAFPFFLTEPQADGA